MQGPIQAVLSCSSRSISLCSRAKVLFFKESKKKNDQEKCERACVTQSALRGCVLVLKFGWRVCWTFRKLYPAGLGFQQADIYSSCL